MKANNDIFAIAVDILGNVSATGNFTNSIGKYYVAKWDGHFWSELGSSSNALNANSFINCLATDSNGNVYAGGSFQNSNNEYYLAKWNGTKWSETGMIGNTLHANGAIKSVAINNKNEVYVAGYFTDGLRYYAAKWNEVSWSSVDNFQSKLPANDPIESISVDANDNLYVGGKFLNKAGHSFVAKWNKTEWNQMGSKGDPFYSNQPIYQIVADSAGNVYVSGDFHDNGGRCYIEHWNGSGWERLGLPDTSNLFIYLSSARQMLVDNKGNLYIPGRRSLGANSYDCVLKWNGAKWSILEDLPNSLGTHNDNPVYGIGEIEMDPQGNIYVAGSFVDSASRLYSMAKWDGKAWSRLPGSYTNYIQNFCVAADGTIYSYGSFNPNAITKYNPTKHYYWDEVASGNSRLTAAGSNVFMAIKTDSKNNLYVNGYFANAAGNRYVAKWDGNSWSEFGVTGSLGGVLEVDHRDNIYSSNDRNSGGDGAVKEWNGNSWVDVGKSTEANDIYPDGSVLATDPLGNVYTIAPSYEPGIGSYIVRYSNIICIPKLSSFTPASGSVRSTVTIKGKNLTGTAMVSFGGTKAASFAVKNDSTITAVVANGSTGSVLVETVGGTDSLQKFTYTCDSVKGPAPYISLTGDSTLVTSYANYYQWFYNNHKLNNETSNSLKISEAGFYHLETSADKVCWVASLDYPVLISRSPSDSFQLSVYPNPSNGNFTAYVKLPKITTVKSYVQVADVNGVQILQTSKLIFYGDEIRIPITINAKGTFFVKVFVNDSAIEQSIIIIL